MSGSAGLSVIRHTIGITSTGGSTLALPKNFSTTNPNIRGCLYSHYDGGNGNDILGLRPWMDIGYRLPVLGLDYGGAAMLAGTATATSSTTLTNTGASWTPGALVGMSVVAGASGANIALITANTSTVLTISPNTWPNGTPGSTAPYFIAPNISPWANPQQMGDMDSGYTYLNSTLGAARGGKINILGFSMGGCNSLVYAAHNRSKVNAVLIGSPALSLYSGMYAPAVNLGGQVNDAYAVTKTNDAHGHVVPTWMTSTSDPTWGTSGGFGTTVASNRDPYWMAANGYASAFAGLPIVIVQGGVKLTCSLTAATFSSGTATATLTGAGITTSNVTVGMWLTWQGMSNQLTGQVTAVSAGSATVTLTAYDGTASTSAQTSAPFWLSNDGTTWPIWAEQFAANVNAVAGGNVQMIYDNLGGHGLYSDAAVAQALTTWMPYA